MNYTNEDFQLFLQLLRGSGKTTTTRAVLEQQMRLHTLAHLGILFMDELALIKPQHVVPEQHDVTQCAAAIALRRRCG